MDKSDKIKPIYQGLQGILSQTPLPEKMSGFYEKSVWEHYNQTVDELNNVTGNDYNKFKVEPKYNEGGGGDGWVSMLEYRSKLNDLIMRLHAEYFSETQTPFSGSPGMIVSQSQQQGQTTQITMILEIQSLVDKKLLTAELNEKERTFLEKVKSALPTIKSVAELINIILTIAKSTGVGVDGLAKIFNI